MLERSEASNPVISTTVRRRDLKTTKRATEGRKIKHGTIHITQHLH